MKKIIFIFMVGFSVLLINNICLADSQNIILSEDFESYSEGTFPSSGGWELVWDGYGTAFQTIVSDTSISPSNSLKLEGKANWFSLANKVLSSTPDVVYLEGYVKAMKVDPSVKNWSVASISFFNVAGGQWGREYAAINFAADGKIEFLAQSEGDWKVKDLNVNWVSKTWYKVKIKYDSVKETGSAWINGELKVSDFDLSGVNGTYNSVGLKGLNDTHTRAWFDDIKVYTSTCYTQEDLDTQYQAGYAAGIADAGGTDTITINSDLSFSIQNAIYKSILGDMDLELYFKFFGEQDGKNLWELDNYKTK